MRKIIRYALGILFFLFVVFAIYLYKLHALALEGNIIFEERCLRVNPPLIGYKNTFLKIADCFNSTKDCKSQEVMTYYNDYISGMRAYVPEEDRWLEKNEKYITRWDFKLIEPFYIKEAAIYQQEMYRGYRDEAYYMLQLVDKKGTTEETNVKFYEAKDRRSKNVELYESMYDKYAPLRDWRKIFGMVPVPKGCTDENTAIPNTSGSIDWGIPTPTPIPINPDSVS